VIIVVVVIVIVVVVAMYWGELLFPATCAQSMVRLFLSIASHRHHHEAASNLPGPVCWSRTR
jgi:hypothetical protein